MIGRRRTLPCSVVWSRRDQEAILPRGPGCSTSRGGDRVVRASADGVAVGVDVEPVSELPPEAAALLAPSEREALAELAASQRGWGFAMLWTRKEAVLKALGTGLRLPVERVVVSGPAEPPAVLSLPRAAPPLRLAEADVGPGYVAHVAATTRRWLAIETSGPAAPSRSAVASG